MKKKIIFVFGVTLVFLLGALTAFSSQPSLSSSSQPISTHIVR